MTPEIIFTIISASAILLLSIASPLFSPFLKVKRPATEPEKSGDEREPVSVVVIPNRNTTALKAHLSAILQQEYQGDFQVIVVAEKGDIDAENALACFENNPRLYFTHIPESSRYVSRRKLAATLGVKAALHEWVILTDTSCFPKDNMWLETMARNFTDDKNLVVGYGQLDETATPFQRFQMFRTACAVVRSSVPWRAIAHNIAFRKSLFLQRHGYRQNLQYTGGEYDFLVNLFAEKGCTVVETSERATVLQETPTNRQWRNNQLQYLSIRRQLRHSAKARWSFNFSTAMMYLADATILAGLLMPLFLPTWHKWILLSVAVVAFIANNILRIHIAGKAIRLFHEHIPQVRIPLYERLLPACQFYRLMQYWKSDKMNYSTHKL